MAKQHLKPYGKVRTRNNSIYHISKDCKRLKYISEHTWCSIDDYSDNLTYDGDDMNDIIEIRDELNNLIWERKIITDAKSVVDYINWIFKNIDSLRISEDEAFSDYIMSFRKEIEQLQK